jgi:hypothetical protein
VALREEQRFDDLSLDYSLGEMLQALSVRETRGDLPAWAVPFAELLVTALQLPPDLPTYAVEAAAVACRSNGYTLPIIVDGLRSVAEDRSSIPSCGLRTLRGFLEDWRRQLRGRRPTPIFSIRPR